MREVDGFTKDGADAIGATIVAYWKRKGAVGVKCWTYRLSAATADWGVRSNLVNGLPPTAERLALYQKRMEFLR